MKRKAALICLLLCAVLLCSCAEGVPASVPDETADVPENIELTLATFPIGNWGNPTAVSNMLASFHKEYPNIRVTAQYLTYDTGDAEIERAVADGQAPDLVLEGPERLVAGWGEKGWMADLSELWESEQAGDVYDMSARPAGTGTGLITSSRSACPRTAWR